MENYKQIEQIFGGSEPFQVGDFQVKNYLPKYSDPQRMSPFFLMDHGPSMTFAAISGKGRTDGLHPHRGIETVSIVFEGSITHFDTKGNGGTINKDEVQWMTAGSGIQHMEFPELPEGGAVDFVQLWINLPKVHKLTGPKYQSLSIDKIPNVSLQDQEGTVRVIAGEYNGIIGPASTFTPMNMYDVRLNRNGKATMSLRSDYNTGIFILKGSVEINEERNVSAQQFVLFKNEGEDILLKATSENAIILVLNGEPLNEPIAHRGPFVMNTEEELIQAYKDYQDGLFD
ncbi:pirin family protein [Peribacillus cavernae]|uniref:Pirin family protein n=1 Tax=Peribacillus cavernae TaxID=1674310 RepID=A0A433HIH3_9BACI|nr:pirin family protein [Peribacillus cavernae]MDQ0217706.1 redox-sensitive bicupin YhaK (pirin superfamily) [Peribacillus cavernae]RUQ28174.1 pirin family protein [Peribacillus cavernae]